MTGEAIFIFALLFITIALFISDRLRLDVVAIMVILALLLSGLLSPQEALAGFGDPVVILIGALFVIGEALFRTGIAHSVGNWLLAVAGTSETRLMVMLMLVIAILSAFMSSTGAVAIFIPIALSLAAKGGLSPSRLMMPMAIAALIGGMLTLIGTPPNLVVSTQLERSGLEPFGFFSFAPVGLVILVIGIGYVLTIGRGLLPKDAGKTAHREARPTMRELADNYGLTGQLHRVRLNDGSKLSGQTVVESRLRTKYAVTIVGIERSERLSVTVTPALANTPLQTGDILYVVSTESALADLLAGEGLERLPTEEAYKYADKELGIGEVMIPPASEFIGRTLREAEFRSRHGLSVLAIQRKGEPYEADFTRTQLELGDTLLVGGGWEQIRLLQGDRKDFLVLSLPAELEEVAPAHRQAPVALLIVLGMLVLMTFKLVPAVTAVLLAALAMVLFRCISMEESYKAINWQSLVLIAGMLPMATALDQTGGVKLIVDGLINGLGDMGPFAVMVGLFGLTSLLSQFISNTAATVLIAPVAVGTAQAMGVSPYTFLMTVAVAASTAFATPVSSPVNTLVLGPGAYRFNDFIKVGVPLILLSMFVTLLLVPLIFPMN